MTPDSKIFVAGHRGLVGSAIMRRLTDCGYKNIITCTHDELDLTNQQAVLKFFEKDRPKYVFDAAARVGGIHANNTYPAQFIYDNLMIECNIIHASYLNNVQKLLFLGSSCVYPKFAPQPMKEEYLMTSELEPTNEPYAIAKISGIKMCASYNRQYGTDYLCVMPTNAYGPGDNYHPENSHALPALILKIHESKTNGVEKVVLWGSGRPRREFIYSDDLADACVFLMEKSGANEVGEFINIGVGKDISLSELAHLIAEIIGYNGKIVFDDSKLDGAPKKLLDVSKLERLGWQPNVKLREGISRAYHSFLEEIAANRVRG